MTIVAVTSALLLLYSILILYYKILWDVIPDDTTDESKKPRTSFTIIIPARNEEDNIGRLLTSIEKQNYPVQLFEVIVLDDFSTDGTAEIIQSFKNVRYYHLSQWISENEINSFKKRAISEAAKLAEGDILLTTDADCEVGPNWLRSLAIPFQEEGYVAVAAPVSFFKKNTLLNIFQELDFMAMQGITAAVLTSKNGAMCNGANFAYTKKAFEGVDGFNGIDQVASGDDMMLMHKFLTAYPDQVGYLKNKDAIVQTNAAETLRSFVRQRVRWAGKNKSLSDRRIQAVLVLTWLTNASLVLVMLSLLWSPENYMYVLLLLIIKGVAEYFFSGDVARFFDRKKRLPFLFILQPLHIFYMTFVGFLGIFNSYTWKERKVK